MSSPVLQYESCIEMIAVHAALIETLSLLWSADSVEMRPKPTRVFTDGETRIVCFARRRGLLDSLLDMPACNRH